ncbi:MAG: hypothetical protein RJA76_1690 [Bacteroidota bacterium]|jgi:hypothetical protein
MVKEFYDRLQNRLMRLMENNMPLRMREAVKDMIMDAERIISRHGRGDKK